MAQAQNNEEQRKLQNKSVMESLYPYRTPDDKKAVGFTYHTDAQLSDLDEVTQKIDEIPGIEDEVANQAKAMYIANNLATQRAKTRTVEVIERPVKTGDARLTQFRININQDTPRIIVLLDKLSCLRHSRGGEVSDSSMKQASVCASLAVHSLDIHPLRHPEAAGTQKLIYL